jgi:hypothetical protein
MVRFRSARFSLSRRARAEPRTRAGTWIALSLATPALVLSLSAAEPAAPEKFPDVPFKIGETITYKINYGTLTGGTAVQRVEEVEAVQGRPTYHIVRRSRSSKFIDVFRPIRELNESWLDAERFTSLKYVENLRNAGYKKESHTVIDPGTGRMTHSYDTTKHQGTTSAAAPGNVQDPISVVYYLRTKDLKVGENYDISMHVGGKIRRIEVRVKGVEDVKVPAGRFETFHIEPELAGKKSEQEMNLEVWVTTDRKRIPVLIKSKLEVGSFAAEMTDYDSGEGMGK